MNKQISGLMLFSRYSWVCAEYRLRATENKMSQEDFEHHRRLIENNMSPDVDFLSRCYKKAVDSYYESCEEYDFEPNFSFVSVTKYWRNKHKGYTPVKIGIVTSVAGDKVSVISSGQMQTVVNIYNLCLEMGDIVYIHQHAIIEKDDMSVTAR